MKLSSSPGHKLVPSHRVLGWIPWWYSLTRTSPVTTCLLWDITPNCGRLCTCPPSVSHPYPVHQPNGPSLLHSAAWVGHASHTLKNTVTYAWQVPGWELLIRLLGTNSLPVHCLAQISPCRIPHPSCSVLTFRAS